MAFKQLHSTCVYVSDPGKAKDFYVDKLGFELRGDWPLDAEGKLRWIEVVPPGAETAILLVHGFGDWSPERVGVGTGIVLTPDDPQRTYEELSARGVEFIEPPTSQGWGIQSQFKDQDGNVFVVVGH
jgi:catechol 2,3-dioxygenase-like lactoylglutathione lyase family enzyme